MTPLEKLDSLEVIEQNAFLAFFAGACGSLRVFRRGDTGEEIRPSFGKAECEWVPFREFWQKRLVALGFVEFEESEPRPAFGMVAGSTFTDVTIRITDEGYAAREAYWEETHKRIDQLAKQWRDKHPEQSA